ncbi:hypothetical protein J2O08_18000 [Elizabethkingia anophelis]|uniref:hypothetical protein n=1 Tax=Elizabethkingia anophelis TaxID=1117645 RepID=UPI0020B3447D|nr:hypothetical protein [Elizabethkingia anophelis]UTF93056.1 hypothetical protein J2O08_18000 [Elizabethkingia anophelis]
MKQKIILFIAFLILFNYHYSQKFISIDSLQSNYKIKKYTFNTKELYGFDKTIEVYNVFITPQKILLVTILPNLKEKDNWKKLKVSIETKEIYTSKQFKNWIYEKNPKNKEFGFEKIIKKINGEYYVSNVSLIELFNIGNYPSPLVSAYGTLNIAENKVSIKEMSKVYADVYTKKDQRLFFPMDVRETEHIQHDNMDYLFRTYFSKEYRIGKDIAYQFWTFDGWWIIDGYNYQRGIDRFVYIPEKGIVGGSYDFYFKLRPKTVQNNISISTDKLWDNILNEKVMIAEELK